MTAGSLVSAPRRSAMRQRDDSESRKVVRVESDWPDTTMNAEEFSRSPSAGGVSDFLAGGGDGALIRAFDWASSPIGPPFTWTVRNETHRSRVVCQTQRNSARTPAGRGLANLATTGGLPAFDMRSMRSWRGIKLLPFIVGRP